MTLQINIGKRDKVGVDKLLRIINEKTNNRDIKIGKIDIFESCSKFDVEPKFAEEVMNKFRGFVFQNRDIGVIEASNRKRRDDDRGERGGRGDRSERGGSSDRYGRNDRKRSDSRGGEDRYDRKKRPSGSNDRNSFGEKKRKFRR
jgi:ATP-dependent RNA helicase DeaD